MYGPDGDDAIPLDLGSVGRLGHHVGEMIPGVRPFGVLQLFEPIVRQLGVRARCGQNPHGWLQITSAISTPPTTSFTAPTIWTSVTLDRRMSPPWAPLTSKLDGPHEG